MCWCVVICFIIYEYRKAFLHAALLFCQPVLLIPSLCTCSLDYLPRLLRLSQLIIILLYSSLGSSFVQFRGSLIGIRTRKNKTIYWLKLPYSLKKSILLVFYVVVCGCLCVYIHACNYLNRWKWWGKVGGVGRSWWRREVGRGKEPDGCRFSNLQHVLDGHHVSFVRSVGIRP